MKIAVFGSGAVGGYFGGRLAASGEDVTFIARGEHLAALRRDGLTITSPKGDLRLPVKATDTPAEVGPVDIVLFTVKMYDVDAAAATLAPMVGPETAIVTMQNGVDVVSMVARQVGLEHVAGGTAYVVAVVDRPGHVRHTVADRLIFGEPDGVRSPRLERFEAAGRKAGFSASASTAVHVDLWTKFVRLSTWSGMTTVTRCPMGIIRGDSALMEMMMAAFDEAVAVGRARGIDFAPDIRESTLAMINGFPEQSKSSMLEDLERGRRLELPWLSGAVARLGRESGVPTPVHQFITTVLTPMVGGPQS